MPRLENLRIVDRVLTERAIGYQNQALIADALFPIVMVDKERSLLPKFGKEAFKIYNTERAIRAESNVMKPEGITTIPLATQEHDLAHPIDYREAAESEYDLYLRATDIVTKAIMLRREKKAADLAQNLANFPTGHKVTLASDAKWSNPTGANSNPIDQIDSGKEAVRAKIGSDPNTLVLGAIAFMHLKKHPAIVDRVKYSMKGVITVELLKEILGIENIYIGKAVYSSDAGIFGDIWQDNAILAYNPTGARSVEEPAFGYTPRRVGNPLVDKYTTEGNKITYIRATDNFEVAIVGNEAGYIINDVAA